MEPNWLTWARKLQAIGQNCVIVRGVTDLVGPDGGDAYNGHADVFVENSKDVMHCLNGFLPNLLSQWLKLQKSQAVP